MNTTSLGSTLPSLPATALSLLKTKLKTSLALFAPLVPKKSSSEERQQLQIQVTAQGMQLSYLSSEQQALMYHLPVASTCHGQWAVAFWPLWDWLKTAGELVVFDLSQPHQLTLTAGKSRTRLECFERVEPLVLAVHGERHPLKGSVLVQAVKDIDHALDKGNYFRRSLNNYRVYSWLNFQDGEAIATTGTVLASSPLPCLPLSVMLNREQAAWVAKMPAGDVEIACWPNTEELQRLAILGRDPGGASWHWQADTRQIQFPIWRDWCPNGPAVKLERAALLAAVQPFIRQAKLSLQVTGPVLKLWNDEHEASLPLSAPTPADWLEGHIKDIVPAELEAALRTMRGQQLAWVWGPVSSRVLLLSDGQRFELLAAINRSEQTAYHN
jgi:hypothetical protein